MYLSELKIWGFRKYGLKGENCELPGLVVHFNNSFNLLIGENDAGKTAIIDAIKLTLGTSSDDASKISEKDFHVLSTGDVLKDIKIECTFTDLSEDEAGQFLEWLSFDEQGAYQLQVRFLAKWTNDVITGERIERVVKAGPENSALRLEGRAREIIRATYLKPLRDAENELKPGMRSRLAQILKNHPAFLNSNPSEQHVLEQVFKRANDEIEVFFEKPYDGEATIKSELQYYLDQFFHIYKEDEPNKNPQFKITQVKLNEILKRLSLSLDDTSSGLGSLNLLFIATELLLITDVVNFGANITLIEEIEAHLHPQAQLRLIKYLQSRNYENTNGQFILSTHSTTLAASTALKHIILVQSDVAYPMSSENTQLDEGDYRFLERFLDSTKANLFFAKGVIFVEGDAENLLLPTFAELLDRPLHRYGVTIVNVGNTAFSRYAKIFGRSEQWLAKYPSLNMPVSIITDVDVRPYEYYVDKETTGTVYAFQTEDQLLEVSRLVDLDVDDLRHLESVAFLTKKEMKEALSLLNDDISQSVYKQIYEITNNTITDELIEQLKEKKSKAINSNLQIENSNIKVFVAPNWTLEYEIALSAIWKYAAKSIHNVKFKDPTSEVNIRKLDRQFHELEGQDIRARAYALYKPLLDKKVSKASVAQELADLLHANKSDIADIICGEPYLEYLREAIFHVTGGNPSV